MKIVNTVCVAFLSVCLPGAISGQEPRCAQFEYDERILSKLLAAEANCKQTGDYLKKLEEEMKTRYDDLERKLQQTSIGFLQQCRDLIDEATTNVLRKPQVETDDWKLIFRGTAGNGDNIYDAWSKGKSVTTSKPSNMRRSNNKHYADLNFMNDWSMQNISEVKVVLFHNEMDVASLVFDAIGSSRDSWFQQKRLLTSHWPSLTKDASIISFSLASHPSRKFLIMKNHGGCAKDAGYFLVNDVFDGHRCDWQLGQTSYPQFMFSGAVGPTIWDRRMYSMADYLAIYAKRNKD